MKISCPASAPTFEPVTGASTYWFPRARRDFDPATAVARLRAAAKAGGRDPATLSITVFNAPADRAKLAAYRDAGITRVLLEVPDVGRDEALRILDKIAPLVRS